MNKKNGKQNGKQNGNTDKTEHTDKTETQIKKFIYRFAINKS
jgi:hypothetical protein